MAEAGFWDNAEHAGKTVARLKALKAVIDPMDAVSGEIDDADLMRQLAEEEDDAATVEQVARDAGRLEKTLDRLETVSLLSGENDPKNCFLSIHAGAGGTESCDWAQMLLRMYLRYAERMGWQSKIVDEVAGDEAGLRSVTAAVTGLYAFGYLSAEVGVHRLVRISPFDSASRRHTSFASVDVIPELEEDFDVEIEDGDLRMDFYHASGAGGQSVNKTSSAVRITHIPSGITVQCQNERSQHQNRRIAMEILRGKLYRLEQQKRDEELAKLYGEKGEIAWGNQIRSYILQPYTLIKDHRTDTETGKVQDVLDGDLDRFVEAYLHHRARRK